MKIGIASDHQGFMMKKRLIEYLKEHDYECVDFGTDTVESVDYPDYAHSLCNALNKKEIQYGIAICYTGIGMSIACNKVKGICAAKVSNKEEAKLTRQHNDANVLVLSAMMNFETATEIIDMFCHTEFSKEERHIRRIGKLEQE